MNDECELRARVLSLPCAHMTAAQAAVFLTRDDPDKDPVARFVAYLIALGIAEPGAARVADAVAALRRDYARRVEEADGDPVAHIAQRAAREITNDLVRSAQRYADPRIADPIAAGARVLALCVLGGRAYIQGFDRFMWVLLALAAGAAAALRCALAEAAALGLLERLLARADIAPLLRPERAVPYFASIDRFVAAESPAAYLRLRRGAACAIQYALRWRFVLFADEHAPRDIPALWDNVVARSGDALERYLRCLAVAHAEQAAAAGAATTEAVQAHRAWDVRRLLARAAEIERGRARRLLSAAADLLFAVGGGPLRVAFDSPL